MRALILAAGRGLRLQQPQDRQLPKCLLPLGGVTLLERHLRLLRAVGVEEVVIGVGFRHELIEAEIARLRWHPRPEIIRNPDFEQGSVSTVHALAAPLTSAPDVLLMDADVLYDIRMLEALTEGKEPCNRLLIDHEFEPGDEPVKVCVRRGIVVELRKRVEPGLAYDAIGESVGFFRLTAGAARRLAELVAGYVMRGASHAPHEEPVRDLILEHSRGFEVRDVTGLPWIEIDYAADVARATRSILPLLDPLPGIELVRATGSGPSRA
ncbi:MAG TPA: NTP transferase domain-containing protein [Steroidobacteraceae bacterium]|nr:NTP transferase domain-containing protein [Steroidobacteraceae bacterium]